MSASSAADRLIVGLDVPTVVEAEKVVQPGELDPADVHVAGVFVDRVVALTPEEAAFKMIEKRTTTPRPGTDEEA